METQINNEKTPVLHRLTGWCRSVMSDFVFMLVLAVIVGIACGVVAFSFKWLIAYISGLCMDGVNFSDPISKWKLVAFPVAGIIITYVFSRYVVRTNAEHGVARLIRKLNAHDYRLKPNLTFSPIVASSITLGMGGTSGSEGPIAYTGAAIGSNVGRLLGLPPDMTRTLIGCGTSAGIAGIFIAPVAGVLFGLEVVRVKMGTLNVLAVFTACLVAYLTAYMLNGWEKAIPLTCDVDCMSLDYTQVIALGIFCGLYSLYYSKATEVMDAGFKKISNPWICCLIGGLMIGGCLLLFPSMYSVGYPVIEKVINGDYAALANGSPLAEHLSGWSVLPLCAMLIIALKCWGVSATNSSGGVGGDFAPTLFSGCMAGFLFASVSNHLLGTDLPVSLFAFLGMGGVMSGAIEAPLMTMFIVVETTGGDAYFLPILIVTFTSYLTVMTGKRLAAREYRLICHNFSFRW